MKIGHWQLECRPGEVGANLDRVIGGLDRVAGEGIAILCVTQGRDLGLEYDGVGYGDSYLLDPFGEIVVRSQRHTEQLIWADLPPEDREADRARSLASARALMPQLQQVLRDASLDS